MWKNLNFNRMRWGSFLLLGALILSGVLPQAADRDPHAGHGSHGNQEGHGDSGGAPSPDQPIHESVELKQGRYIGYLEFDDSKNKLATIADFYIESPENFKEFPKLNAILKYSYGGYGGHEYFTEIFRNLQYDFDHGVMTMDEDGNEFILSTEVVKSGDNTLITGSFFVRTSGQHGRVHLLHFPSLLTSNILTENSPSSNRRATNAIEKALNPLKYLMGNGNEARFWPEIEGQYVGKCDDKTAALQIQTARGLNLGDGGGSVGFEKMYRLGARLAFKNDEICYGAGDRGSTWCTIFSFHSATANIFLGQIIFQGDNANQECKIGLDKISCDVSSRHETRHCELYRLNPRVHRPIFHAREYHLPLTNESRRELPPPEPPANKELSQALNGLFTGWLHNETTNTYQMMALSVFAYSSTENPHNPNQMMITTSLYRYFDGKVGPHFINERFSPRSFYIRPGFVLNNPNSDSFIEILEWRRGYIRGNFYSHSFGKVGSIELLKGSTIPQILGPFHGVPSFTGEYVGPGSTAKGRHLLNLLFVPSSTDSNSSLAYFRGNYQFVAGDTGRLPIRLGSYDPYTGRIAMLNNVGTTLFIVNGQLTDDHGMQLFWPPNPNSFGARMDDWTWTTYTRTKNNDQ